MGFGIYSSIAGANAREIELEVLANNIANIQTTGYKEMQVSFTSEVDKNLNMDDMQKAQSLVRQNSSHINLKQGSVFQTGNPLDVAIQGAGFFTVQTEAGVRYTRNGNFTINSDGLLMTQTGAPVLSNEGQIVIPTGAQVTIASGGQVMANGEVLGKLRVVDIVEKDKIKAEGGNTYTVPEGSTINEITDVRVAQGHLEGSNVDLLRNMTRMIEVSRAYESHQKSMSKQIESSQQLNQIAKLG